MSHQFLYGPLDIKNKFLYKSDNQQIERNLNARLSLRLLADYRFLVYSLIILILMKYLIFNNSSNLTILFLMFFIYFCYILVKTFVNYKI